MSTVWQKESAIVEQGDSKDSALQINPAYSCISAYINLFVLAGKPSFSSDSQSFHSG